MIDLFLKLIDKLTELVRYKGELRKKQFDLLIAPAYQDLKEIHENYLKMFESCKSELQKGTNPLDVYEKLKVDRLDKEALRRSIIEKSEILKNMERFKAYWNFFGRIHKYFEYGAVFEPHVVGTKSTVVLAMIETKKSSKEIQTIFPYNVQLDDDFSKEARKAISELIDGILIELRNDWKDISRLYAEILAQVSKN